MSFRSPLSGEATQRARRERISPRPSDPHFLHLHSLRDGLARVFAEISEREAPGRAIDIFCGTSPYRSIMPPGDLVTVDIDFHFGRPSVVAGVQQPFGDATFDVAICTQALYLLADRDELVQEMRRILRPGGTAVVTVPVIFRSETSETEHRYSPAEFTAVFSNWVDVDISRAGGLGTGAAYWINAWLGGLSRRLSIPVWAQRAAYRAVNMAAGVADRALDRVVGDRQRPATLIATARRPVD